MATPVIMPKQGQSVETCVITTWFRQKGDTVKTGEILCSYETDKASFDLESPADGILLDIFFSDGDEVPVLENIAVIGTEGEESESFRPGSEKSALSSVRNNQDRKEKNIETPVTTEGRIAEMAGGRIKISPRAKKLAQLKKVDIKTVAGSGPGGRIMVRDIEMSVKAAPSPTASKASVTENGYGFSDKPLSNVRRIIASAMHASLQNSAQLTHHMSADVRKILEARRKIKDRIQSGEKTQDITLNDMICYCAIKALKKFPEVNSHFMGDSIRTFTGVHIGLAVDTPRGLMVPAIKNADAMSLSALSDNLREAAEACRHGTINPELLRSTEASFTVTNLGAYGVEMFTPVINLPQVAILGVCTIIHRPADIGNGVMGLIPVIGLSLTYDHRAIDGGPATLFLKEIKTEIEKFEIQATSRTSPSS